MKTNKTGYDYRTRKEREIMAFVCDSCDNIIDTINPGTGNHRTALEWAERRAVSVPTDYPGAVRMAIYCGGVNIAIIDLDQPGPTTPTNFDSFDDSEKETYNRVAAAIARAGTFGAFPALPRGAMVIVLHARHFSDSYVRGERKGMTAEDAAKELTEHAAALVSRELREIDTICATIFLAERISRLRKQVEHPERLRPSVAI